jgi:predicted nucleic acid-binding Zn ribbon protein
VSRVRLIGRPTPTRSVCGGEVSGEPVRETIEAMKGRRREWLPTGRARVLWFVALAVLLVWLVLLLVGVTTTNGGGDEPDATTSGCVQPSGA